MSMHHPHDSGTRTSPLPSSVMLNECRALQVVIIQMMCEVGGKGLGRYLKLHSHHRYEFSGGRRGREDWGGGVSESGKCE